MSFTLAKWSALLALAASVSAHFTLVYPTPRGFNEDTLTQSPCGGQNEVSSNRTVWPNGGPIQLNMGHTTARVQASMALGNQPGDNFDIVLRPIFLETGLNNFCMGMVTVPAGVNITAGMNATIQVVTYSEDAPGGLYNCADITFTDTPLSPDVYSNLCMNSTGVTASPVGAPTTSGSGSTTSSTTSATPQSAAARTLAAGWVLGAMVIIGGLIAL